MQPHLLYVFRMINNTARMMMMPMTMTAIIAPEPVKELEEKEKETRNNYSVDQTQRVVCILFTFAYCAVSFAGSRIKIQIITW